MALQIEYPKPLIGAIVHISRQQVKSSDVIASLKSLLEERLVLIFPQINITDEEQLALTNSLGGEARFERNAPGVDASAPGIYQITLDRTRNTEPDYVLGTFFWHIDGVVVDIPLPKLTLLSARQLSVEGGSTEFANLYAAYDRLTEEDKQAYEDLRAIHSVEAAVRPVYARSDSSRIERYKVFGPPIDQPLVWKHGDGRRSLLVVTHADGIVDMPGPHGRALLTRLQQWAAQPDFVLRHEWTVGDLVVWNNHGLMHRVVPYADEKRVMHRTVVAGTYRSGRPAHDRDLANIYEFA